MAVSTDVGIAGMILVLFSQLPKAVVAVRNRDQVHVLAGISRHTMLLESTSGALWLAYSFERVPLYAFTSIQVLTVWGITAVIMCRARVLSLQAFMGAVGWCAAVFGAALWLVPLDIVGPGVVILDSVMFVPQAVVSWRSIGTPAIRGWSAVAVTSAIVSNTLWGMYAYLLHDIWVTVGSVLLVSTLVAIFTARVVD